jgi:hypothetical protein
MIESGFLKRLMFLYRLGDQLEEDGPGMELGYVVKDARIGK